MPEVTHHSATSSLLTCISHDCSPSFLQERAGYSKKMIPRHSIAGCLWRS
nr:MAG TPA: hypothetical protein [Caudoviricetes sp.]DAY78882.1 MAG TPA: hypothetical protein [Caudoviricetes sp.]